ncbi:hypothetical protein OAV67_00050 [Alphaproteobacteria bacterium]|nr:hypothetical protein [Alphaproteobacteria bacterium]
MTGDDGNSIAGLWKSIEMLLKEALADQNEPHTHSSKVAEDLSCSSADVIHLNKVVWPGNTVRDARGPDSLSEPHPSMVQGLYTQNQINLETEKNNQSTPFSEKMARLISDICASDDGGPSSRDEEKSFMSDEELRASHLHNFDPSLMTHKILAESLAKEKKEMFSPQSRAVLMGMIDSHIARWIDQNLAEFLEDSLPSSEPRARDAKVKHRS